MIDRNDGAGRLGDGDEVLLVRAEGNLRSADDVAATVVLRRALADKPDLVVLNRFGRLEAEGGGMSAELLDLMADGVPVLTAETRFPLGTFRVWTYWRPAAQVLVYPAPEAHPPPLPPGEPRAGGAASTQKQTTGELDGVRAYRRGDPLKLVVWKKAAKSDELVSRDASTSASQELWLDLPRALPDTEAQLSRLAAWVLAADRLGLNYGLRLPGFELPCAGGHGQRLAALQAEASEQGGRKVFQLKGKSEDLDGVMIFNPEGKAIGFIKLPERCANLTFGGPKNNRLYMTSCHSVYALYVESHGAV